MPGHYMNKACKMPVTENRIEDRLFLGSGGWFGCASAGVKEKS